MYNLNSLDGRNNSILTKMITLFTNMDVKKAFDILKMNCCAPLHKTL